jgi:hypothetical protein
LPAEPASTFCRIYGFEEPTLAAVDPKVTGGSDVGDIRILRMHHDAADGACLFQPDVLPGAASVGGAVNAVTHSEEELRFVRLTSADPDHIGIGRRNSHGADRERRLLVEDRLEGRAVCRRLEHAARREPNVKHAGVSWVERNVRDASRHNGRTNRACFEIFEEDLGQRRRNRRLRLNFSRRRRRRSGLRRRCGGSSLREERRCVRREKSNRADKRTNEHRAT